MSKGGPVTTTEGHDTADTRRGSSAAPARLLTQKQRILAFMGDGEWHTTYDMKHAPGGPEIGYPLCRKEELEREGYVFEDRWHEATQQKEWRLVRRLDGSRPGEHKPEPATVGNAQPAERKRQQMALWR